MIGVYLAMVTFFRKMRQGWQDAEFRGLFWSVLMLLIVGSIFYRNVEGWSWIDSFYFTVVTLTTVGYGDFAPATNLGKLFTVLYIVMGLGMLSSFIIKLATISVQRKDRNNISWQPLLYGKKSKKSEEEE